jgi:hypothetical protein
MGGPGSRPGIAKALRVRQVLYNLCYLLKCWPRERLKPVAKFAPGLFLVVSTEMLALLPFACVSSELYACHPRPVNGYDARRALSTMR